MTKAFATCCSHLRSRMKTVAHDFTTALSIRGIGLCGTLASDL